MPRDTWKREPGLHPVNHDFCFLPPTFAQRTRVASRTGEAQSLIGETAARRYLVRSAQSGRTEPEGHRLEGQLRALSEWATIGSEPAIRHLRGYPVSRQSDRRGDPRRLLNPWRQGRIYLPDAPYQQHLAGRLLDGRAVPNAYPAALVPDAVFRKGDFHARIGRCRARQFSMAASHCAGHSLTAIRANVRAQWAGRRGEAEYT